MATARWRKLRQEFGSHRLVLLYLLHRLLLRLSGGRMRLVLYALYAQPVPSPALQALKPDAQTLIRPAFAGDVLATQFPRPPEVLQARWAAGAECHVAEVKGQFAGFLWLSHGEHQEDEVRCDFRLPADAVWDHDVYIEPRLRLSRTLARLWAAVDADLAARGKRWSFSRIARFNPASVRSHERLGARCVGLASFLVCGDWQLSWLPQRRWPSLSRSRRPLVELVRPPR